jgi:hypothetical protein
LFQGRNRRNSSEDLLVKLQNQSSETMRLSAAILCVVCVITCARAAPPPATQTTVSVIDAQTLKPIDRFFTVMMPAKSSGATWQIHTRKAHTGGHFIVDHARIWSAADIRVWAPGHKPSILKLDMTSAANAEVWLKPAIPFKGRVIDQNGKPVQDAQVALASEFSPVHINEGHLKLHHPAAPGSAAIVRTSADGTFELPGDEEVAVVAVAHESGLALVKIGDATDPIKLQPWAHIEGHVLMGTKPAAGWQVSFNRSIPAGSGYAWVSSWETQICDAKGRYKTGPLIPGNLQASVAVKNDASFSMVASVTTFVDVKPGQTLNLTLGGKGRPVIGRLIGSDGKPAANRKLWIRPPSPHIGMPGDQEMWEAESIFHTACAGVRYSQEVVTDASGNFRIERLPQGSFEIDGAWNLPYEKNHFEVKPMEGGTTDDPMDLGDLREEPKTK